MSLYVLSAFPTVFYPVGVGQERMSLLKTVALAARDRYHADEEKRRGSQFILAFQP